MPAAVDPVHDGERPDLSIVIPAFDEAERLPRSLRKIAAYLGERCADLEIVIVDDGSRDDTGGAALASARELGLRLRVLRHTPNRGKGFAARRGMLDAHGEALLLTDADLSVPIDHLQAFIARLDAGAEWVSASRHLPGSKLAVRQPTLRERCGAGFRWIASRLFSGVSDFTCGFKLFRRDAARRIFERQRISGWAYDVELFVIAHQLGIRVVEEPVAWHDDRDTRVRIVRDALRSLADLLQILWNRAQGRYSAT